MVSMFKTVQLKNINNKQKQKAMENQYWQKIYLESRSRSRSRFDLNQIQIQSDRSRQN